MGAENSVLEGCDWGEQVSVEGLDWDLQHATTKDDRIITVFQPLRNERKYNDMIQQLAKSLKMLRHPSILRYVGAGKFSEGHFLVTERATPLTAVMDRLSPLEICAGFCDILDVLIFLHDKAGVTHNNICSLSIFVADDGCWRLGELQHACPFASATAEFLDACRAFRNQDTLSPEEKQSKVEVREGQGHARDMYAMGVLFDSFSEQLSELGEFGKSFEQKIGACLSGDSTQRPRALELRNDILFQNDFIQILSFVRNVALKTAEEKTEFFSNLLPRLLALPEELIARRLAIPLLSRFVLLDEAAVTHVVPNLLTPKSESEETTDMTPLLSGQLFKDHVIPKIEGILLVHDAHIRTVLLRHFSAFVHLFNREKLQNEIFPQILLGLRDTSEELVAQSLRALADLVPILGGDVVIGGQRKTFFFHGMPRFIDTKETDHQLGNVEDILKPVKTLTLVNGKPLLKDLAAGYTGKPKNNPEHEKKMMERERRREEARQRKEERQRRFKQQQEQAVQSAQQLGDAKSLETEADKKGTSLGRSDTTISGQDDLDNTDQLIIDSDRSQTLKPNGGVDDRLKDSDKGIAFDKEENKISDNVLVEDEKFASEPSEDEWEDWANDGDGSQLPSHEDIIISDQIEAELAQMSAQQTQRAVVGSKIPTSPDPYRKHSPTQVDWSDSQFDQVSRESQQRDRESPVNDQSSQYSKKEHSSESKTTSGKGLKLVAKNKTLTTKAVQAKKKVASDDLGLGYDIKSIELSAVKEVDFFADMVPDFPSKTDEELLGVGMKPDRKEIKFGDSKGTSLFAVAAENGAEDSGGWDDEGDWGGDDF